MTPREALWEGEPVKVEDIPFQLKDGRAAVLRSLRDEDAEDLLEHLKAAVRETSFLLSEPEECDSLTIEDEKGLIARKHDAENEAMMACMVDGRIAGTCDIAFKGMMKTRHRAEVALAVRSEFWGQGIGSRMLREMIRIAEEREGILQVELEFIEGNARGRSLYERLGFKIASVQPNAIRSKDGTLLNVYLMIKELAR